MKVVTYQSPNGDTINLTRAQASKLTAARMWPRDYRGQEYCSVSHGLHRGEPTYTDAEIAALIDAAA